MSQWHINLWETDKRWFCSFFEETLGKIFFSYTSKTSSVFEIRHWSCTGTNGLPVLWGLTKWFINAWKEVRRIDEGEKNFKEE